MATVVTDPRSYDPGKCPVCGAPRRVVDWAKRPLDQETVYIPGKHECTARCWETMSPDEWNRRRQEAVEEGRD